MFSCRCVAGSGLKSGGGPTPLLALDAGFWKKAFSAVVDGDGRRGSDRIGFFGFAVGPLEKKRFSIAKKNNILGR